MDQLSMWEATANDRKDRPALDGDQHCDVVIIGGGFTGISTAYHLQQKQCKTIILEKERVGFGASGRNGGEILTGYVMSMETATQKKGMEAAKQMWQLSLDSIDLIENIINKHQISCAFKRNGEFVAAYKPAHLESMKKHQAFMAKHFNYPLKIVEKQDLHKELKTSFYHGGHVDEKSAHFHPLNYAIGLAEVVEELGGTIYEHTEAVQIHRESPNKAVVTTNSGRIIANEVVIATNAYSGDLNQKIKKTVVPVESIMIATEPLPEELLESLIRHDRAIHDTKRLLYYFRRTADHRMAFGGSGRSSSKKDQRNLFVNLRNSMIEVLPELEDASIEYQWGGKVGFTQEMVPYMGRLEDGTHFAFGFAGHGAAMTSMAGKLLAEAILHEETADNPLRKEKIRPIPFYSQHAKAVGVLKFYKQFLDRIS